MKPPDGKVPAGKRPVAPPAYRPQPVPRVLQRKTASPGRPQQTAPEANRPAKPRAGHVAQPVAKPVAPQKVIQPYFTISKGSLYRDSPSTIGNWYNLMGTIAVAPNGTTFPGQDKDRGTGSFNKANKIKANLRDNAQPALRISDDYQMAIEETDVNRRQAKCFFAAPDLIAQANSELKRVNSTFKLVSMPETVEVYVPWKRQKFRLNKVVPQVRGSQLPNPLKMQSQELCNQMAKQVSGADTEQVLVPRYAQNTNGARSGLLMQEIELVVAQLVAIKMGTERPDAPEFKLSDVVKDEEYRRLRATEGMKAIERKEAQAINEIARKYVQALRKSGSADVLRDIGLNDFAAPKIGDSFVTKSIAAEDPDSGKVKDIQRGKTYKPVFGFHFAGVVARSGNDVVTLENYSRAHEDTKVRANPDSTQDPRWFFQMYSVKNARQTFHYAMNATGDFANPLTMVLKNPNKKTRTQHVRVVPQPLAIPPRVTTGQAMAGSALLVMIAGTVLRQYGLI